MKLFVKQTELIDFFKLFISRIKALNSFELHDFMYFLMPEIDFGFLLHLDTCIRFLIC